MYKQGDKTPTPSSHVKNESDNKVTSELDSVSISGSRKFRLTRDSGGFITSSNWEERRVLLSPKGKLLIS